MKIHNQLKEFAIVTLLVLLLLIVLSFFNCAGTHKLQKEPSYEQYQKNTQWKT